MLDAGWIPSDYEERYDADNDVYDGINAMFIIFEDNPAVAGAEIQWDACFFYKK